MQQNTRTRGFKWRW